MRIASVLLCAGLLTACDRPKQPDPSQTYVAPASALDGGAAPLDASVAPKSAGDAGPTYEFTGTVRGVVKLAKGKTLPLAPPPLTHGATPPSIAPCPPVDKSDQRTVALSSKTNGLSPIHVALTGMRGLPPHEPETHQVFIDACRMRPTLLGAMRGDKVQVTNRSEMALVPQLPGTGFMRGLLRNESQTFEPNAVQTHVGCSFGSYCGESLIITLQHPLYDVTTDEGFFTIEHVPLDQEIKVHAWHPLFNEANASIRLSHDKPEAMVELLLEPAPQKPWPTPLPAPKNEGKSRVILKKPAKAP